MIVYILPRWTNIPMPHFENKQNEAKRSEAGETWGMVSKDAAAKSICGRIFFPSVFFNWRTARVILVVEFHGKLLNSEENLFTADES